MKERFRFSSFGRFTVGEPGISGRSSNWTTSIVFSSFLEEPIASSNLTTHSEDSSIKVLSA